MAKKKYISLTGIQYTFPVIIKEKPVWVSFKGNDNEYIADNKDVQDAIEATDKFKNKEIGLSEKQVADEGKEEVPGLEPSVFENVTDINGAVEILKGEPYKVHHMKLLAPTAVSDQAKLNNVSFPNWTL